MGSQLRGREFLGGMLRAGQSDPLKSLGRVREGGSPGHWTAWEPAYWPLPLADAVVEAKRKVLGTECV